MTGRTKFNLESILATHARKVVTKRDAAAAEIVLVAPQVQALFADGKFPIPDFKQIQIPEKPKKVFHKADRRFNDDHDNYKYVFAGYWPSGKKRYNRVPREQSAPQVTAGHSEKMDIPNDVRQFSEALKSTFQTKGLERVGRFTEPAKVKSVEVNDAEKESLMPITFVISYGFGDTISSYLTNHDELIRDCVDIHTLYGSAKSSRQHTPYGINVTHWLRPVQVAELLSLGLLKNGSLAVYDIELLVHYIRSK